MELLDPHAVVIYAVLIVHVLGVLILAVSAGVLVLSLGVVIMTVHGVRCAWALKGNPSRPSKQHTVKEDVPHPPPRHARTRY